MIVDAHQHFIQFNREEYPWIGDGMTVLQRDLLPDDLSAASRAVGVDATVAVQARQSLAETQWLIELAHANSSVAGVVGWVDLRDPQVDALLERLSAERSVVGVRHVIHDEPDDDFMLRDDFCRGISRLARYGLTYDILIFSRHLPQALQFVRRFPDQPFVIDHIAKPRIRDGELLEWRRKLAPLAKCDNVFCKLSGMVTEAKPALWKPEDFRPYIETVLELFGADRVMFGSDWPVCTLETAYTEVFEIVDGAISGASEHERDCIFGRTAEQFYGLSLP
ncbi:amidohydrolase family protein [Salinispira pacifica]